MRGFFSSISFVVIIFTLSMARSSTFADAQSCGNVTTIYTEFTLNFARPVLWDDKALTKLVKVNHQLIDPVGVLKLAAEESAKPSDYLGAISSDNCNLFYQIWDQAVEAEKPIAE